MKEIKVNDVVQFTKKHKWYGCLGIVEETREEKVNKYLIGIPITGGFTSYIFDDGSNIEYIGPAAFKRREEK